MQTGLVRLDQQIVDGPRPFIADQCRADDLREPICSRLVSIEDVATKWGFHFPRYTVSNSTGINVHGGAIRMLHESSRMFLQILASSSGAMIQEYQILISATEKPINIFASTNGRPGYNALAGVRTQRKIGTTLEQLFELHNQSIVSLKGNPVCFDSFDKVGTAMDHLSNLFYTDKIERGIFMPVP